MRLSRVRRTLMYLVTTALVVTGCLWLFADQLKAGDDGETWQRVSANTLMVHGGAAMLALLLIGALFDGHIVRSWRSGRNRMTGIAMATINAGLIVTAFALYYFSSEVVRQWTSNSHIAFGLAMPMMLVFHIWRGRKSRASMSCEDDGRVRSKLPISRETGQIDAAERRC